MVISTSTPPPSCVSWGLSVPGNEAQHLQFCWLEHVFQPSRLISDAPFRLASLPRLLQRRKYILSCVVVLHSFHFVASEILHHSFAGAGKSSLMRILAGQDEDFQGNLQLSNGIKVGYLQQEPKLDMEATVLGNIEPALASTKSMLSEFEEVRISELFRHRNGPFVKQHLHLQ